MLRKQHAKSISFVNTKISLHFCSRGHEASAEEFKKVKINLRKLDSVMMVGRDKSEKLLIIKHNRKYGRTADLEATLIDTLARDGYGACKVVNAEVPREGSVVTSSSSCSIPSSSYR